MAEDRKKKSDDRVPVTLLFFRALIGLYLIWLAYGLRKTALSGAEGSLPMLAAMIVFAAVGAALVIMSVKKYLRWEFLLPGSEDVTEEDVPEEKAPDSDKG